MTGLEIFLTVTLAVLYLALLCTVGILTFRKGYLAFGILGFIFPIFWLIGALLPKVPSSRYDVSEYQREQGLEAGQRGGAL